jgi:hypothetical protein
LGQAEFASQRSCAMNYFRKSFVAISFLIAGCGRGIVQSDRPDEPEAVVSPEGNTSVDERIVTDQMPDDATSNSGEFALDGFETPIWTSEQLAELEEATSRTQQFVLKKPPYYKGEMPLTFTMGRVDSNPIGHRIVYHRFPAFQNNFLYRDNSNKHACIADGAWTIDSTGRLLAEARLTRVLTDASNKFTGVEIEEFHYGPDSKLEFWSRSKIGRLDQKEFEEASVGTKQRDFYYLWPIRAQ